MVENGETLEPGEIFDRHRSSAISGEHTEDTIEGHGDVMPELPADTVFDRINAQFLDDPVLATINADQAFGALVRASTISPYRYFRDKTFMNMDPDSALEGMLAQVIAAGEDADQREMFTSEWHIFERLDEYGMIAPPGSLVNALKEVRCLLQTARELSANPEEAKLWAHEYKLLRDFVDCTRVFVDSEFRHLTVAHVNGDKDLDMKDFNFEVLARAIHLPYWRDVFEQEIVHVNHIPSREERYNRLKWFERYILWLERQNLLLQASI